MIMASLAEHRSATPALLQSIVYRASQEFQILRLKDEGCRCSSVAQNQGPARGLALRHLYRIRLLRRILRARQISRLWGRFAYRREHPCIAVFVPLEIG